MFFLLSQRSGQVVAAFRHWSDLQEYQASNRQHRYDLLDDPGMDEVLARMMSHHGSQEGKTQKTARQDQSQARG